MAFLDIAEYAGVAPVERLAPLAARRPLFRRCHLTDLDDRSRALAEMEASLWGGGVLVDNAGTDDRHMIDDVTPDYRDQRVNVNLRHMFFAARAVAPAMKRQLAASS